MTKIFNKLDIEEMYFNKIKALDEKPTPNINSIVKVASFSSVIRNKTKMPTITTPK